MVRFHVVYHQIIYLPVPYLVPDIREKLFLESDGSSIYECYLFIDDQIGVVTDSVWERPLALEEDCRHVIDAYIADSFRKFHIQSLGFVMLDCKFTKLIPLFAKFVSGAFQISRNRVLTIMLSVITILFYIKNINYL